MRDFVYRPLKMNSNKVLDIYDNEHLKYIKKYLNKSQMLVYINEIRLDGFEDEYLNPYRFIGNNKAYLKNLKHIDSLQTFIDANAVALLQCPQLETLTISFPFGQYVNNDFFEQMVENLPNLKRFIYFIDEDVDGPKITKEGLRYLKKHKSIDHLILNRISPDLIKYIKHLPLRELWIYHSVLSDDDIENIANIGTLRTLCFIDNSGFTKDALEALKNNEKIEFTKE